MVLDEKTTEEQVARPIWNQTSVPVAVRQTQKGKKLLIRLPYRRDNRIWLDGLGKTRAD